MLANQKMDVSDENITSLNKKRKFRWVLYAKKLRNKSQYRNFVNKS